MNIKQGEIWEVEFSPSIGSEIGKKCPALVVSHDKIGRLPLKTIVPITDWSKAFTNYPWMMQVTNNKKNGLSKESAIDCFQIRNFSNKHFVKKLGDIDEESLFRVHQTIAKTLDPRYQLDL